MPPPAARLQARSRGGQRRTQEEDPSPLLDQPAGLLPDKKTVLVVGGGDGVGSLSTIVEQTAAQLAKDCPGAAQVHGMG